MQDFTLGFSRVTPSAAAAHSELKHQVQDLVARAYYNLHGHSIANADPAWVTAITGAGMQLRTDARTDALSQRMLIHLFENVIRVSEEHLHEARRHAAMAANVFYLKETTLDTLMMDAYSAGFSMASTTVIGLETLAHTGRLDVPKPGN